MLGKLLPLALAAAVYPTLLAGVIIILARPNPLRMLLGFLTGGMAISIGAGIAIVRALEGTGFVDSDHRSTKPAIDITIGTLSLLVAWGIHSRRLTGEFIRKRRREPSREGPKKPSVTSRALGRGSVWMAVIAGVVLNLPGIWYLDALAVIAKAESSTGTALLQILFFNVIMFALVEIPIILTIVDPQGSAETVMNVQRRVGRHSRTIAIAVTVAIGLYLLIKGIVNL